MDIVEKTRILLNKYYDGHPLSDKIGRYSSATLSYAINSLKDKNKPIDLISYNILMATNDVDKEIRDIINPVITDITPHNFKDMLYVIKAKNALALNEDPSTVWMMLP